MALLWAKGLILAEEGKASWLGWFIYAAVGGRSK